MREVDCICGERIVFLDEEVQVKTCPNCGIPVYQYATPKSFESTLRVKKLRKMSIPGYWMAGLLIIILLAAISVGGMSVVRDKALSRAARDEQVAETARLRGDYSVADGAYKRALVAYERWGSDSESVDRVRAALDEVALALAEARARIGAREAQPMPLPVSLEELARRAYMSNAVGGSEEFQRDYAGKWVIIRGRTLAQRSGPFKTAGLTISYRVFSPEGRPVEFTFSEPFFERFRVREDTDVVVRAVLKGMRFERGSASDEGRWVIVADASASRLVTDVEELRALSWDVDEALEKIISRQSLLSPAY